MTRRSWFASLLAIANAPKLAIARPRRLYSRIFGPRPEPIYTPERLSQTRLSAQGRKEFEYSQQVKADFEEKLLYLKLARFGRINHWTLLAKLGIPHHPKDPT